MWMSKGKSAIDLQPVYLGGAKGFLRIQTNPILLSVFPHFLTKGLSLLKKDFVLILFRP